MKLITEVNEELEVFEIDEDSTGKKSLYLEGVFLQAETVNKNKRTYPREILEREVKRYNKDYIKESRAFGELGHPEGPTINLERVSHLHPCTHCKIFVFSLYHRTLLLLFLFVVLIHPRRQNLERRALILEL